MEKTLRPAATLDRNQLQTLLWRKFISTEGVLEDLLRSVEVVKNSVVEDTQSEEEFLPLSESSRLSTSDSLTIEIKSKVCVATLQSVLMCICKGFVV